MSIPIVTNPLTETVAGVGIVLAVIELVGIVDAVTDVLAATVVDVFIAVVFADAAREKKINRYIL